MTNIPDAKRIHYIPRNTTYRVLKHNISIKTESGWVNGCLYQDESSGKSYCRPYHLFDDRWTVVE